MAIPRLIASELDGTLLQSNGQVSRRTKTAVKAAEDAGMKVVLVTARPPRVVREIAEAAGVTGPAVCSNGAMLYDVRNDAILHHKRLDATLARELVRALRGLSSKVVFATEHGHLLGYEPGFPRIFEDGIPEHLSPIGDVEFLCEADLTKIIVHEPGAHPDVLAQWVAAHVGQRAFVTHSGGAFVEIGAAGVTKASGLARLCDELGVAAVDVVAIGDMPNDISMLRFAGRSVAVANAHPQVLAEVDEVTDANDDDGVARFIERLLEERG